MRKGNRPIQDFLSWLPCMFWMYLYRWLDPVTQGHDGNTCRVSTTTFRSFQQKQALMSNIFCRALAMLTYSELHMFVSCQQFCHPGVSCQQFRHPGVLCQQFCHPGMKFRGRLYVSRGSNSRQQPCGSIDSRLQSALVYPD